MRVAEEVERRLLMAASPDCFRFMVDVERLSTRRGREEVERKGGGGGGGGGQTREEEEEEVFIFKLTGVRLMAKGLCGLDTGKEEEP